ncbi:MAG: DUF1858 domain-containing protein [Lachnospiraceae bacterium]|nr:DUF1858 domain-containing protein [Lachnospiraceae bacterium]
MAKTVSKDMIINQILSVDPGIAPILMASGMHCISCFAASGESLEEAAMVHGLDAQDIEDMINEYLALKDDGQITEDDLADLAKFS